MEKKVIAKIIALAGIIGFFVGLAFLGSNVFAQSACTVSGVELDPAGTQSGWYTDNNRSVAIDATLSNCQGSTVYLRVWGRTSAGNVIVADKAIPVGAGPTNEIVKLKNAAINIGEDGCVIARSPQCQYYLTFSDGPSVEIFSSQANPLRPTIKDTIGFNYRGAPDRTTTINNFTLESFQSTYTLTLNTQGDGQAIGGGTFPIDTEVNAQALPDPGNYLVEWTEGGARVSADSRIKVKLTNADRTLTAVFASGTSPYLSGGSGNLQTQSDCTIGPVNFNPQGNLLFAYAGGILPVQIEWLATNCYGKKLQVTIGAHSTLPAPIAVSTEVLEFNDARFGFSATNPYAQNKDILKMATTANLGDGPCDLALFPACQYFIEIEDISPVSSLGVLHSSRGAALRTTSMDTVGFHCFGACDIASTVSAWSTVLLEKEYPLIITIKTDGQIDTRGGSVQGQGRYPINSDVNIDAFPNPGYQFLNWELSAGGSTQVITAKRAIATMSGKVDLVANFVANTSKNLTVNVVGNGSVVGDGSYPTGSRIELVATPNSGWRFQAWKRPNTGGAMEVIGRAPGIIIELTNDATIEAEFVEMGALGIDGSGTQDEGLVPCQDDCDYNHFITLVERVIDYIFILVLPLAGLLAVITGIMFLTSGGNPAAREKAKKAFGKFFIGLIVVMIAWLLVATILKILNVDGAYSFLDL